MGIRFKLSLFVVCFVFSLLSVLEAVSLRVERQIYLDEMEDRAVALLESFSIPCAVAMANHNLPTLDTYIIQFAKAANQMDLRYLAVLDFDGKTVAHTHTGKFGSYEKDEFTLKALASDEPVLRQHDVNDEKILEVSVPIVSGLRWGTLKAGFHLQQLEAKLAAGQKRSLLIGLLVSLGAALLAYVFLSYLVLKPLLRMSRMAKDFGQGNLEVRVDVPQKDEIGLLAERFNGMAAQIQGYTGGLRRLVEERTEELESVNQRLRSANTELERLAQTDPLTGLYNRRYFLEQLDVEIKRAGRNPHSFCLLILDVDHFKNYNDQNGHPAGDALLQHLAAVLESNLRTTDILCRYGGEEFAVLLLDTELEEGNNTANKIREVISIQPFDHAEKQPQGCLSVSVGIAAHPFDGENSEELIDHADQALYQSKARGRNCVTSWTEMSVA
ncbi:MAG: hypothetical protein CMH60_05910 [Myxococcales bacterium]|nr:hypothetical protein [Myxococcales bacterium]